MVHSHVTDWLMEIFNGFPSIDPVISVSVSAILTIAFLTFDHFKNKK